MDVNFLIYIIVFLVVVVLLFKLIKKVVFAIIGVVFLCVLIVLGIGTMVYFDYQDILGQDSYKVNLFYGDSSNPEFGVNFVLMNNSFEKVSLSSFDVSKVDSKFLSDMDKGEEFYVFVDEDYFEDFLSENETYYLLGTEEFNIDGLRLDSGLSKEEVLYVLGASDSAKAYVDILFENNEISFKLESLVRDFVEEDFEDKFGDVEIREALFLNILVISLDDNYVELLNGFRDEDIEVYPTRFSFKFIRWLPVDFLLKDSN